MGKIKQLVIQFLKFGTVGGICFLVDYGLLAFLHEVFSVDTLIASAISFSVSVVLNYILSMRFVFVGKGKSKTVEFIIFVLLSIGGLLLNQLIMWLGTRELLIHYLIVKIAATAIVLVYNFVTRKLFIEKH